MSSDLLSEQGGELARLRAAFDAATREYLSWGTLPESERTESKRRLLDVGRRAADVALANAEAKAAHPAPDGPTRGRAIEDIVRAAGGTVL